MKGYLVTGTDTEVGKTLISAALLTRLAQQHPRVAGYKPVAAGCATDGSNEDVELLRRCSILLCRPVQRTDDRIDLG